jgi:hypothetical protein
MNHTHRNTSLVMQHCDLVSNPKSNLSSWQLLHHPTNKNKNKANNKTLSLLTQGFCPYRVIITYSSTLGTSIYSRLLTYTIVKHITDTINCTCSSFMSVQQITDMIESYILCMAGEGSHQKSPKAPLSICHGGQISL